MHAPLSNLIFAFGYVHAPVLAPALINRSGVRIIIYSSSGRSETVDILDLKSVNCGRALKSKTSQNLREVFFKRVVSVTTKFAIETLRAGSNGM